MRLPDELISGSDEQATKALDKLVEAIRDKNLGAYVEFEPTFAYFRSDREEPVLMDYTKGCIKNL